MSAAKTYMNTTKWQRISDSAGDGYANGEARIWDNGAGMGSSRDSGRWAVEIAGTWVANVDTLAEAKTLASERI
jgi:hypothetical protein